MTLDKDTLLTCAAELITEGFFALVLPVDIGNTFVQRAQTMGWHLRLRTDVAETEIRRRIAYCWLSPTAGVFQRSADCPWA